MTSLSFFFPPDADHDGSPRPEPVRRRLHLSAAAVVAMVCGAYCALVVLRALPLNVPMLATAVVVGYLGLIGAALSAQEDDVEPR